MALSKKYSEIPEDAVVLSEKDALKYQWKLIEEWTPSSDVWPLRFGFAIVGTASGLSALYINNHFRHKLRLGQYGRVSSYIPNVVIPTIMTCFFHQEMITSNVLLANACPVCLEVRAAVIQTCLSTLFPLITAPLASFNFAMRYNTYRMPSIAENTRDVLNLWKKFLKPVKMTLYYNLAFQIVLAMGMTYLEGNSMYKINTKIHNLENTIDNR